MASVYQRGKIWWIKYSTNGVRVQESLNTSNQRVAQSKLRQVEYLLETRGLVQPSETPLAEFLEDFCSHIRSIRTYNSYRKDLSYLRIFFGPICESLKPGHTGNKDKTLSKKPKVQDLFKGRHVQATLLEQVTTEMVSQFISRRVREDGIAPKTANRIRGILHVMFAYAIKEKGYRGPDGSRSNPVSQVDRRQEPAASIRFLDLAQIDGQIQVLDDHPTVQAIVATLIYAGLRREEVLWLTLYDVDLEQHLIRVRAKTVDVEFWQPKTKRNRVVPISSALMRFLAAYFPPRSGPWFFPSPCGLRWDPDDFSHRLREINREHGLIWSCLDFRHTFGSHLAQKGESLYKIAQLMGNSPEICRRHYAALVPEEMHDVVEFGVPRLRTVGNPGGFRKTRRKVVAMAEAAQSGREPA
jgi:integrase